MTEFRDNEVQLNGRMNMHFLAVPVVRRKRLFVLRERTATVSVSPYRDSESGTKIITKSIQTIAYVGIRRAADVHVCVRGGGG